MKKNANKSKWAGGYTLIELMATLAIMVIITSVILVGRPQYENSILLSNLAYDTALNIRQSQVYGINVRGAANSNCPSGSGSSIYCSGYGVHFKRGNYTSSSEASDVSFILFADINNNRRYDSGESIGEYKISGTSGKFGKLCVIAASAGNNCSEVSTLDITFRRPDPAACINTGLPLDDGRGYGVESSTFCQTYLGTTGGVIELIGTDNSLRYVTAYSNGQITVTKPTAGSGSGSGSGTGSGTLTL